MNLLRAYHLDKYVYCIYVYVLIHAGIEVKPC